MSNQGEQKGSRRVLLVSYYFPPSGGPGVQRVLKFVRYLPGLGYIPHVLTVPESAEFPVRDPSLLEEVPPEARRSFGWRFMTIWRIPTAMTRSRVSLPGFKPRPRLRPRRR